MTPFGFYLINMLLFQKNLSLTKRFLKVIDKIFFIELFPVSEKLKKKNDNNRMLGNFQFDIKAIMLPKT